MLSKEFIQANFPKGKVTLLAGRPAMGKSSFAVSLALSLVEQGLAPMYFSLEMSDELLTKRMKIQMGEEAYDQIHGSVLVDDTPRAKTEYIRHEVERFTIDIVIVDYVQLMDAEPEESSRNAELQKIIQGLKEIAEESNLPVVVLCQLNRLIPMTERYIPGQYVRLPSLFDISEGIRECLDDVNVVFLHRPEYYLIKEKYDNGKRIVGKTEFIKYNDSKPTVTYLHFNHHTTEVSMWLTWERLKVEILNSPNWLISLDQNDIKEMESDNSEVSVFEATTENASENRFNELSNRIANECIKACLPQAERTRILMFIQFPLSAPIMMSEMTAINKLIDKLFPDGKDCSVKWGLSPREDNISRIVCAINPNV